MTRLEDEIIQIIVNKNSGDLTHSGIKMYITEKPLLVSEE
jgi:hypothetical protein